MDRAQPTTCRDRAAPEAPVARAQGDGRNVIAVMRSPDAASVILLTVRRGSSSVGRAAAFQASRPVRCAIPSGGPSVAGEVMRCCISHCRISG